MKRSLQFAVLLVMGMSALVAEAQQTAVTATVKDSNGVPYAGGSATIALVSIGGQIEYLNGAAYTPPGPVQLDSGGNFAVNLASNSSLQPSGSTYSITTCSSTSGTVPPFSSTPTCFTVPSIMISGSAFNLSSILSAAAPVLNAGGSGSGNVSASGTPSVNQLTTWVDPTHIQGTTMPAHSFTIWEGASTPTSITSPSTNGNCIVSFNVTSAAPVDPTCALPGVTVNAQSGIYSLQYSDRSAYLRFSGGTTATLTLCQITGNCASNFPFVVQNLNSGALTITANAADKIDGGALGGSITLSTGMTAFMYQDSSSAPGNWWTIKLFNSTQRIEPLIATGNDVGQAAGTNYLRLVGVISNGTNELAATQLFPLAGTFSGLCVATATAQPSTGGMTVTFRDTTAASDLTNTISIAANAAAGTFCDTTHTDTITANHLYVLRVVNSASTASGAVTGVGGVYAY